ncbi:MAG: hypothetical protein JJ975_04730 [Bacteroidia bacterium]|nr:hypothetical protein [Bacteroidia bacterium]
MERPILRDRVLQWGSLILQKSDSRQKFYAIRNLDGSIRWIWPSSNTLPLFLAFYSATSLKSKAFVFFCQVVFSLRLQSLFFESVHLKLRELKAKYNTGDIASWALFTGTIGPNRKAVLLKQEKQGKSSFTKIAIGSSAFDLIHAEYANLNLIKELRLSNVEAPVPISLTSSGLQLTALKKGKRSTQLTPNHMAFLQEKYNRTNAERELQSCPFWRNSIFRLNELGGARDNRIPRGLLRKLRSVLSKTDESAAVELSFAHGDFTPWNCWTTNGKLSVYDWELASPMMPKCFDAFHFIIQKGILIERKHWDQILKEIKSNIGTTFFKGDYDEMARYLRLYLVHTITSYVKIFSNQPKWHEQVHWLFSIWNEAVSWILEDLVEQRKLLLMDVFDALQTKDYCALKFNGFTPESLPEHSDLDLVMSRELANNLFYRLSKHSLVRSIKSIQYSFMRRLQIQLKNGQLLFIDSIWELKRKNLVFQATQELLSNSKTNFFGVKQPSLASQSKYVNLFYRLNGEHPPSQYTSASLDLYIDDRCASSNPKQIQKMLHGELMKMKQNKGSRWLINTLNYMIDTVRTFLFDTGMIVTFSGVDGAGKSTLIESTRKHVNKVLRKPVVVIRHRPSLLPILSTFVHGKEKAEHLATVTNPRMGTNANIFSSLLRFFYYYLDYLFGQFYVYVKYVRRGKVVLYDRYYFDFISDPKRSNIRLPKWLTKLGYKLILKPKINFFIYADPEIVYQRKQELNTQTITQLTRDYLDLFSELKQSDPKKYQAVKNHDLDQTLNHIYTELKAQVA